VNEHVPDERGTAERDPAPTADRADEAPTEDAPATVADDPASGEGSTDLAAASRRRILLALTDLEHDRPELVAAFAHATLRRVPETQLRGADPAAAARRILGAYQSMDRRRSGEVRVEVLRPSTGLDGRPAASKVVQVVTEDRPFLLSTVIDELERGGLRVVRSLHPIVGVERDADGRVAAILPARTTEQRESVIHLEVEGPLPPSEEEELATRIGELIGDVVAATDDHERMRSRIREVAGQLRDGTWTASPGQDPAADEQEVAALLDWLLEDNLVLLGVREYEAADAAGHPGVVVVPGSGLGLLSDEARSRFLEPVALEDLPPRVRARIERAPLLTVTRTTRLSTVQRRVRMEYVGLTRRDADGAFLGELRILGLFTRKGLSEPTRATPVLRRKLAAILEREDVVDGSHDAVTLASLFQALPKDELFQAATDELHRTLVGLLYAEEHREVRSLLRVDHATRTVSVLVAVPRDHYSPQLRERVQRLLVDRYGTGRVDVEVSLGDRNEALARFLLHLDGAVPDVSPTGLQAEIRALARSWDDEVVQRLRTGIGDAEAERLVTTIVQRLPRAYRDTVPPADAVADVLLLDHTTRDDLPLLVALRHDVITPDASAPHQDLARLRVAKRGEPVELSGFIPLLESLGLTVIEEIPHRLEDGGPPLHLHDFGVRAADIDIDADGPRIADAVLAAWRGHLQVDALNQLVLVAGLDWRDVGLVRAYRRLRRQLGTAYTPEYVNETIVGHPDVARAFVTYLHARFDPVQEGDPARQEATRQQVLTALDALSRLDHDRILRGLLTLIDATLRTNAFRPDAVADGSGEPYIALKIDPSRIPDAPRPVPYREIFVHSPRVEGVHLRGGAVARGGLRWSDRRDDVRTEVLDLVKAQILKNALIVPTGAKGGFVVTREPNDPQALRDEVRRQYVTFIRGLLDVTDDLEGDRVVPPPNVVRHDGDDPYLVVAADRGTATFSDTANEVSARYGFWLDDAFASGGSNGYDHKALGVTARGAWVAVQRHFRELGIDVQTEPITVAGIGDMSGDVFGNGLLRSRTVRLVAAFDHRDIFLDPDPDPASSFEERQRLFELPRSNWQDYDRDRLSPGGGIFARSARSVPISAEVRGALRIDAEELTPPELIQAILRAPVDLLFAGGIGTYVKSSGERNDDVGDRANDELRVDARDLRARVYGEGANLSITQRGRIEYARRGGHINQDAIDNAAGVSTSDHEVNVKILLTLAQEDGLLDGEERDEVLASFADEVVDLVLDEIDRQTAAISREVELSAASLDPYRQLLDRLETVHELNRDEQILPNDGELATRAEAGAGLTRPELGTLLAWAKRDLKEALLDSPVPDSPLLAPSVSAYFPQRLVERFPGLPMRHRLRRELVATTVANDLVDRMGVAFPANLAAELQVPITDVVLAYRVAREVFAADGWWDLLDAHEVSHTPTRVRELEAPLRALLTAVTATLLTEPLPEDATTLVERDRPVAERLRDGLVSLGTQDQRRARVAHARWLVDDLVDPELARLLASARDLAMVPDVAQVLAASDHDRAATDVADAFLRLGDGLGIDRLEDLLVRTTPTSPWARRQRTGLAADLRRARRDAAEVALAAHPDLSEEAAAHRFLSDRSAPITRVRAVIAAAERVERDRLHAVGVATRSIWDAIERFG
jgi:glutamate dehydrogenase